MQAHIALPIEITVLLVGFDGSGGYGVELVAADLEAYLGSALNEHCPTVGSRRERSLACFHPVFSVTHVSSSLGALEAALRENMVRTTRQLRNARRMDSSYPFESFVSF